MAFDKTLPTNSTKIRNYPTVLGDNFAAIEEGDLTLTHWQINFIERNAVPGAPPPANDPTRQDDTMIMFSKQDGAGETELFILDDRSPANNFQITEAGKIGSASTQFVAQDISFAAETATYASTNMVAYWGYISSAGVIQDSSGGFTSARNSVGNYTITFSVAQSSGNYGVNLTARNNNSSDNPHIANYHTQVAGSFKVMIRNQNNTPVDRGFSFSVFGGRP